MIHTAVISVLISHNVDVFTASYLNLTYNDTSDKPDLVTGMLVRLVRMAEVSSPDIINPASW